MMGWCSRICLLYGYLNQQNTEHERNCIRTSGHLSWRDELPKYLLVTVHRFVNVYKFSNVLKILKRTILNLG